MSDVPAIPFDVCGPLPTGVTVLEASAGTGKTYTIAALAARCVAAGTPLERLLLVTFTRNATGELRERVRERLVSLEHSLSQAIVGAAQTGGDPVAELLATGDREEVQRRRDRLARSVADFDAATIATTHSFCQEILGGLGIAGDLETDAAFVEDPTDLIEEVVDDLYVRRSEGLAQPPFSRAEAGAVAHIAIGNPSAPIAPATGDIPEMRVRLAEAARTEFDARKRRLSVVTYDDLLTRLHDTLTGTAGDAVAARLRTRYAVVLVDEFQDTDPIQWEIMWRAFGAEGVTLILIGDPKQAIYAFRGGDVYAYLKAARSAVTRATLQTNWRSDQGLIDAYDALFDGARLGHAGIVYRQVVAATANQTPRISGAPSDTPLRFRVVHRDEPAIDLTARGFAEQGSTCAHVASDVAADLVALLSSTAEIESRADDGTVLGLERVAPGHVAVLVPTNRRAALIRDALDAAGIPAVISGAGSVFGTAPAEEWLRLLEALERPASQARAKSASLTCFFGWPAQRVALADDEAWEEVHRRLHSWARVLRVKGVASLLETIMLVERIPERVLRTADGERWLTDLRHVGQLLHAAATAEQMGTTALAAWLRRRIAEAKSDTSDEERSRRLESDDEAVQVITIHRSKGLEFPIVYLPFLWEASWIPDGDPPVFFHDADADDVRTIDVGLAGADYRRHKQQHLDEERGEDLRLAYVALTRARHQTVVWWAGSFGSRNSPLSRLLFSREADGTIKSADSNVPDDATAFARFEAIAAKAPGRAAVERSSLGLPIIWAGPIRAAADLTSVAFDRQLDWYWRRTSYSDITAGTYEPRVASEPEEAVVTDEPSTAPTPTDVTPDDATMTTPSLLAEMPVGLDIGTLVHRVLEATDFAAPDLDAELAAQIAAAQARRRTDIGDPNDVVAGLRAAIETPLGPALDGTRLLDVCRQDRLDELDFELPLAGGDEPTGEFALTAIAAVLREHLPAGDPLAGYAERLLDPRLRRTVRGYLSGSIDVVLHVPGPGGVPRFAIVDYKTNWLAAPGETLTAWHHRPSALAAEMVRSHYGLQALLYSAALHRYLRWRLPDYDAERNLAGVFYLFLRGMTGADTPTIDGTPCGVFTWRPSKALVATLSDALDGRSTA